MEDGAFCSVAAGDATAKPIFKGVCAAGEIRAGEVGEGFNFSGKFGRAGAEGSGANFNSLGMLGVLAVKFIFAGSE
jgi:hypothetical protein